MVFVQWGASIELREEAKRFCCCISIFFCWAAKTWCTSDLVLWWWLVFMVFKLSALGVTSIVAVAATFEIYSPPETSIESKTEGAA